MENKDSILFQWINSLEVSKACDSFDDLIDGQMFFDLLSSIFPTHFYGHEYEKMDDVITLYTILIEVLYEKELSRSIMMEFKTKINLDSDRNNIIYLIELIIGAFSFADEFSFKAKLAQLEEKSQDYILKVVEKVTKNTFSMEKKESCSSLDEYVSVVSKVRRMLIKGETSEKTEIMEIIDLLGNGFSRAIEEIYQFNKKQIIYDNLKCNQQNENEELKSKLTKYEKCKTDLEQVRQSLPSLQEKLNTIDKEKNEAISKSLEQEKEVLQLQEELNLTSSILKDKDNELQQLKIQFKRNEQEEAQKELLKELKSLKLRLLNSNKTKKFEEKIDNAINCVVEEVNNCVQESAIETKNVIADDVIRCSQDSWETWETGDDLVPLSLKSSEITHILNTWTSDKTKLDFFYSWVETLKCLALPSLKDVFTETQGAAAAASAFLGNDVSDDEDDVTIFLNDSSSTHLQMREYSNESTISPMKLQTDLVSGLQFTGISKVLRDGFLYLLIPVLRQQSAHPLSVQTRTYGWTSGKKKGKAKVSECLTLEETSADNEDPFLDLEEYVYDLRVKVERDINPVHKNLINPATEKVLELKFRDQYLLVNEFFLPDPVDNTILVECKRPLVKSQNPEKLDIKMNHSHRVDNSQGIVSGFRSLFKGGLFGSNGPAIRDGTSDESEVSKPGGTDLKPSSMYEKPLTEEKIEPGNFQTLEVEFNIENSVKPDDNISDTESVVTSSTAPETSVPNTIFPSLNPMNSIFPSFTPWLRSSSVGDRVCPERQVSSDEVANSLFESLSLHRHYDDLLEQPLSGLGKKKESGEKKISSSEKIVGNRKLNRKVKQSTSDKMGTKEMKTMNKKVTVKKSSAGEIGDSPVFSRRVSEPGSTNKIAARLEALRNK